MNDHNLTLIAGALAAAGLCAASAARADAVTDWNAVAGETLVQARMGTPPAVRAMAIVQTAVHEAVASVQRLQAGEGALEAAVAAATRAALVRLAPQQQPAVLATYRDRLARIGAAPAVAEGIAAGEQAAARVIAWRAGDGFDAPDRYRPHAAPGAYVPTAGVATPHWGQRQPWLMASGAQFRPGPPPALASAQWARDFDEVRTVGAKASSARTPEQTAVAKFWEFSLPPIYHAVLRSVADAPGRSIAQNARFYAAASQAMDDGLIAVMDAKYHYGFWRPITAIRNGDRDGNAATEADPGWAALIDNPVHPEYPSAHSILAGALAAVVDAESRATGMRPALATSSPSAGGATRRWDSADAFAREVADSRIWAGIHFRTATDVGLAMGRRIGALATTRVAEAPATAGLSAALVPPAPVRVLETLGARGVQVYECRADAAAPGGARWNFVAPEALLYDGAGRPVGRHGAGPHWEAADGSRVTGSVEARADAPQPDAVPWLLLATKAVGNGGRLAGVTRIQRINTQGGVAPATGCDAGGVGAIRRVPYTADYVMLAS